MQEIGCITHGISQRTSVIKVFSLRTQGDGFMFCGMGFYKLGYKGKSFFAWLEEA
jgi:hypothetical protein